VGSYSKHCSEPYIAIKVSNFLTGEQFMNYYLALWNQSSCIITIKPNQSN